MKFSKYFWIIIFSISLSAFFNSCGGNDEQMNYLAVKVTGDNNWSILITNDGTLKFRNKFKHRPSEVENSRFIVQNKKGYLDIWDVNDEENPYKSEHYTQIGRFFSSDVTFAVKEGCAISIVDKNYDEITTLPASITMTCSFSEGLAAFCDNGKWGFINDSGKTVITAQFESATVFENGIASVVLNGQWIIIDHNGQKVGTDVFQDIRRTNWSETFYSESNQQPK